MRVLHRICEYSALTSALRRENHGVHGLEKEYLLDLCTGVSVLASVRTDAAFQHAAREDVNNRNGEMEAQEMLLAYSK